MSKLQEQSFIEHEVVKKGLKLKSEYKGAKIPFKCECSYCGRVVNVVWSNLKAGQGGCRHCGVKQRSGGNHYKWYKNREEAILRERCRKRCSNLLRRCLKKTQEEKCGTTSEIIGYKPVELLRHFESFQEWHSTKKTDWHIDHIFPIKAFLDYGVIDYKLMNSLDNLRPVMSVVNLLKSDFYDNSLFEAWLLRKGASWDTK